MKRYVILVLLSALSLTAGENPPGLRKLDQRVEIEGKIVCVGCTLQNQEGGADAQCTLYAKHAQGLLAPDGTIWTFVNNARGNLLIGNEDLRGQEVKILGWKFPKAQYIEVFKYQVREGDTWVGYDYCKTCGFEPCDNQDTDLCEDCRE